MRRASLLVLSLLFTACGTGPAGPQGPQGPQGESGASLTRTYRCSGQGNNGSSSFNLQHTVYVLSDGGVMTTCNIWASAFWLTGFNMYRENQVGAAVGGCLVAADIDGTNDFGYWTMETNATRTASTATYRNSGSSLDNRAFTLSCTSS